jgi:hypothetical protein
MNVLKVEKLSVHDNFFGVGGHSLTSTLVNLRMTNTFGVQFPGTVLIEAPTIAELANKLLQDPNEGQRIEQIAALLVSAEEMSDEDVQNVDCERAAAGLMK